MDGTGLIIYFTTASDGLWDEAKAAERALEVIPLSVLREYAVDVPPGARGPFITRGGVVRAYAAFYFLPAIQVTRADRVFHYRFR